MAKCGGLMNRQHIPVISCCHGEPNCCEFCEESCAKRYAERVRNPEYPSGMTMDELVTTSETVYCIQCGRVPSDENVITPDWVDADHDGFCPVPFMRSTLMKIAILEHEIWQLKRQSKGNENA